MSQRVIEMAGRYIKKRKQSWYSNIPIPPRYRHLHGGKAKVEQSLKTRDERVAERKARAMAAKLQLEWAAKVDGCRDSAAALRLETYEASRQAALSGHIVFDIAQGLTELDPELVEEAVSVETDEVRNKALLRSDPDENPEGEVVLPPLEKARLDGLWDGLRELKGEAPDSRASYEPPFAQVAQQWLKEWQSRPDRKEANTGQQYAATIRMFAEWWGPRSTRRIKASDAAAYVSHLRTLAAGDVRNRRKPLETAADQQRQGLKDGTINRHVGTLKTIWLWAKQRGNAEGDNPWDGLRSRLTKRNTSTYLPWTVEELHHLLVNNPPMRRELYEISYMALYTGLRISELADLTWGRVLEADGIHYLTVDDAKTEAGIREVPLHGNLHWFLGKSRGQADDAVWPNFNPEGPSKSRGDDASRMFGDHKRRLGFAVRRKAFHSFRKNITSEMEQLGVAPNEWARIIGHEPGFTYGVYSPHGLTLQKKHEIINRLAYRGLALPTPAELYGSADRLPRERKKTKSR